ncbi:hypothetical protein DVH24_013807, partial [Malus domestica]
KGVFDPTKIQKRLEKLCKKKIELVSPKIQIKESTVIEKKVHKHAELVPSKPQKKDETKEKEKGSPKPPEKEEKKKKREEKKDEVKEEVKVVEVKTKEMLLLPNHRKRKKQKKDGNQLPRLHISFTMFMLPNL